MRNHTRTIFMILIVIIGYILLLSFTGCEGSDAKKAVTDTVKEMVGSGVVKKGEEMKKQIDTAMKEEAKRLIKMDKENNGKATGEGSGKGTEKESNQ